MLEKILNYFSEISKIPRCSKQESAIVQYIQKWAIAKGFKYMTDPYGNTLVYPPETTPQIILQSHVDMVCEKTKDSNHDFEKDPITLTDDGVYIKANKTSLGADNGIGMAISMCLKEELMSSTRNISLLFTVDEETGLNGAKHLDKSFLNSRYLINLDSEEDNTFIVGCAGGTDMIIKKELSSKTSENITVTHIEIDGLNGGHSGIDIDKGYANAIKLLTELMIAIEVEYILDIRGGTAHNAIPRSASAALLTNYTKEDINRIFYQICQRYPLDNAKLTISHVTQHRGVLFYFKEILKTLSKLNHGVFTRMKGRFQGIETSSNLAKIELANNTLIIVESLRSTTDGAMDLLKKNIEKKLTGFSYYYCCDYPGWVPKENSTLLEEGIRSYRKLFNEQPNIKVIHAGLECGVFSQKNPFLDIISLGPNIHNPHSPDEKLEKLSVQKIYNLTKDIIISLSHRG
ncbi:MAG: beta-Ala-His dipeptidase [Calditerrivibrio sp.]|nr:beta-Ala-His dipeptidase [Calditerrivibrio sp.]